MEQIYITDNLTVIILGGNYDVVDVQFVVKTQIKHLSDDLLVIEGYVQPTVPCWGIESFGKPISSINVQNKVNLIENNFKEIQKKDYHKSGAKTPC